MSVGVGVGVGLKCIWILCSWLSRVDRLGLIYGMYGLSIFIVQVWGWVGFAVSEAMKRFECCIFYSCIRLKICLVQLMMKKEKIKQK